MIFSNSLPKKSPVKATVHPDCHRHFELPKRIGMPGGYGKSTGKRQVSVLAAEKNATTILPLSIDLFTAFLQKKEKE
jgi:hypothetical protein